MSSDSAEKVREKDSARVRSNESIMRFLLFLSNNRLLILLFAYMLTMCCFAIAANFTDAAPSAIMARSMSSGGYNTGMKLQSAVASPDLMGAAPRESFMFDGGDAATTQLEAKPSASESSVGAQVVKDMEESLQKLTAKKQGKSIERMLVHTASMSLETDFGQLSNLTARIEVIVTKQGNGYVESQSAYVIGYNRKATEMELRVDGAKFAEVVHVIEHLVKPELVISVSKSSRDVTEEFVDASARADVLEVSLEGLKNLMKKAQNIGEVIKVRTELNQATEQYESYRSRANILQSQSRLSTVTVRIEEREPESKPIKPEPETFFHPTQKIHQAVNEICIVIGFIADGVVYMTVWLIPFLLCYALFSACVLCLVRRIRVVAAEQGFVPFASQQAPEC